MFCGNCGQEIGDAKFCPNCGAPAGLPTGTLVIRKATLNTLVGIGADVYVDGQFNTSLDNLNKVTLTLPSGTHEIRPQIDDYADAIATISIGANFTINYVLEVDENNKMTQLAEWEDPRATSVTASAPAQPGPVVSRSNGVKQGIVCQRCGSNNVNVQVISENLGGTTITKTKGTMKEKGHGLFWWLFIGWWWKIIDLCIWFFAFFPRLIIAIVFPKKKKYKTESITVAKTSNKIVHTKICTCQNCGNSWKIRI